MSRFFGSIIIGLIIGAIIGLYVSLEFAPVEYVDYPIESLATQYQDEYTILVASGYVYDQDDAGAIERLRILGIENVPEHVQRTAERFIANSRDIHDIQYLVALSAGLGRFTPIMEPYRQIDLSENRP